MIYIVSFGLSVRIIWVNMVCMKYVEQVSYWPQIHEPQHSNAYIACAPSEDSDQPAYQQSDQSWQGTLWVANGKNRLQADGKDFDQPTQMCRMILVFAGRICSLVVNAVFWVI